MTTAKALKAVRDELKPLGVTIKHDKEWGEYIVSKGKATYHTDDLQDALGTGKAMAAPKAKRKPKAKPRGYVIYRGPSMIDGAPIVAVALTSKSTNSKTGNMVQTYILRDGVNPIEAVRKGLDVSICGTCPHRGDGTGKGRSCYVTLIHGPSAVHRALSRDSYPYAFDAMIGGSRAFGDTSSPRIDELGAGRPVRLGTYGDPAAVPSYVWAELTSKAAGWTGYTHQWRAMGSTPRGAVFQRLVMASCDSEQDQHDAAAQGWRSFRVRTADAPMLPNEIVCPASEEAGKRTTCADCRLCSGTSTRTHKVITIVAHGSGASNFAR